MNSPRHGRRTDSRWLLSILLCATVLALLPGLALAQGAASTATAETAIAPLNINTEPAVALSDLLPGIGPAKARAIVEYREAHGPFMAVEDLLQVSGIGPATLADIRAAVVAEPLPE